MLAKKVSNEERIQTYDILAKLNPKEKKVYYDKKYDKNKKF